MKSIKLPAELT